MSVPTCFEHIIGFDRKECPCVGESWDSDYSESESGLYITELPGMPAGFIDSLGGCYTIWEKMTNSLTNAINTFKIDVLGEIYKYWEPSRRKYKGDIGNKSFTQTLSACSYQGLRMYSDIIGGSYILRGFWLILSVTEAITLEIYDEYDLLYTYHLTSEAGKPKYNAITPLELDLAGNYYFIYTTTGVAYNNKLTSNCGGYKWCFDTCNNSCFGQSRENWTEWSQVAGVCGDVLADREYWGTSRDAHGLILHGDFTCDILGTLCSDHTDWTDEIGLAIAHAIWYKTGEYLATFIMDTEEVSRKTLLGVEQWNANRAFYNARYVTMINFIAENFESEENECLQCKPPMGYKHRVQML